MEELMEILNNLHPDVDFETEERLVDRSEERRVGKECM